MTETMMMERDENKVAVMNISSDCDPPLVLGLDLEDLHGPLLSSVQSFGFFAVPL